MEELNQSLSEKSDLLAPTPFVKYEANGRFYNMHKHLQQNERFGDETLNESENLQLSTKTQDLLKREWQRLAYLGQLEVKQLKTKITQLEGQITNLKTEKEQFQDAYTKSQADLLDLTKFHKSITETKSDRPPMTEEQKQKLEEMSHVIVKLDSCEHSVLVQDIVRNHLKSLEDTTWEHKMSFPGVCPHTHLLYPENVVIPLVNWIPKVKQETGIDIPTAITGKTTTGENYQFDAAALAKFPYNPNPFVDYTPWIQDPRNPNVWKIQAQDGVWVEMPAAAVGEALREYLRGVYNIIGSWEPSDRMKDLLLKNYANEKGMLDPEYAKVLEGVKWDLRTHTHSELLQRLNAPNSVAFANPFDNFDGNQVPIQHLDSENDVYNLRYVLHTIQPLTESDFQTYHELLEATEKGVLTATEWKKLATYLGQLTQLHFLRSGMFNESSVEAYDLAQIHKENEERLSKELCEVQEKYEAASTSRVDIPTLEGVATKVEDLTAEPYNSSEYTDLLEVAREYVHDHLLREYENPRNTRIEMVVRQLIYLNVGIRRVIAHYKQTTQYSEETPEYCKEIQDTVQHYYDIWKKANNFWFTSLQRGQRQNANWALQSAIDKMKSESGKFTAHVEAWADIIRDSMPSHCHLANVSAEEIEMLDDTFHSVHVKKEPQYTLPVICIKSEPEETNKVNHTVTVNEDHLLDTPVLQCSSAPVLQCSSAPVLQCSSAPVPQCPDAPVLHLQSTIQEQRNQQAAMAASNALNQFGLATQSQTNQTCYDAMSDETMKPLARQLMLQHDAANRPYQRWRKDQIMLQEKLSNQTDPQTASFFWTAFGEGIEFTDLPWLAKTMKLTELVTPDLKNAITSQPINAGANLVPQQREKFDKRMFFEIKAMLKSRNNYNPMLHLQQKIESLDRLPEYPRIEALEKFQNAIQAINSLVPSDMNLSHSPYLTKMISRFDHKFFEKYQLFLKRTNMTPMLSALAVFLDEQYASTKEYQQINPGNRVSNHSSHGSRPNKITSYATTTTTTTQPTEEKWCALPRHAGITSHYLTGCKVYENMPADQRKKELGAMKGICWRCTKRFHGTCDVPTEKCTKCRSYHHKILPCIPSRPQGKGYTPKPKPRTQPPRYEDKKKEVSSNHAQIESNHTSLSEVTSYTPLTLACYLENKKTGQVFPTILYQDNGCSHTIVHRQLAEEAGLEGTEETLQMTTMKGTEAVKGIYTDQFALVSMDKNIRVPFSAWAMNKRPEYKHLPVMPIKKKYEYLKKCNFPTNEATTIGVTVGRDQFKLLLARQVIEGKPGQPIAILTTLGWSVSVPENQTGLQLYRTTIKRIKAEPLDVKCPNPSKPGENCSFSPVELEESSKPGEQPPSSSVSELEALEKIENVWFQEPHVNQSVEKQKTLEALTDSIQVDKSNAVSIRIPFTAKIDNFTNNYNEVIPRQIANEKALQKKNMFTNYAELIKDMAAKGYIEEIHDDKPQEGNKVYIPHFAVYKDSPTTPVRIVFDAKAKMRCGLSYNDCVATAPDLQQLLTDVLLAFRKGPFCFSVDVVKMFHQVLIPPEQRDQNRLIFREPGEKNFKTYRLRTWWMGNTCAPAAVQLAVLKTAEALQKQLPLGHEVITCQTYMDDAMGSYFTEKEALDAMLQTIKIFSACKMNCAKLISNSEVIMKALPPEMRLKNWETGDLPGTRILGYFLNAGKDTLSTPCDLAQTVCPTTKRTLLHLLASLYDPIGFHAPYLVLSRILLQLCWKRGLDWDDPLPPDLQAEVNKWYKQLPLLNEINFQRCISRKPLKAIFIFCDSSEDAFGCVAYAITDDSSYIIASKGRVHSNKTKNSIPRKELMSAVLAAKMAETLKRNFPGVPITFWSDSTNVLSWIKNDWRKYQLFVANRVYYIQSISDPKDWLWIPTALNPADIVSRGANLQDLKDNKFWLHGPAFLTDPKEEWPEKKTFGENKSEMKKTEMKSLFSMENFATLLTRAPDMDDFATIQELVTEMTRLRREKEDKEDGSVQTIQENEAALKELIKFAQSEAYPDELADLRAKSPISRSSRIFQLCPILDEDGLIRLKTRLEHSETVPFDTKYPILLPPNHALTRLIILDLHDKTNHAYGNNYLLSELRAHYWVPKGTQQIKRVRKDCKQCQAIHARPRVPQMAPLPLPRSSKPLKTFLHVGVDFTGHFLCKQGRGKAREKRYVAVFTCLNSRAIHLEMVSKLETSDFQNTLTCFAARRGVPTTLYCDNATNFVGSSREIKRLVDAMDQDAISDYTRRNGFEFRWIPPRSPHMGGAWESMVKSAKRAIRATLGQREFTDWELYTALCQCEDIINSRPLCFVNSDPNDFSVLTPNMFLTGRQDNQVFPDSVDTTSFNASDPRLRWRYIMSASAHMWSRWQREILPTIGTRSKWISDNRNYEEGDECLLIDPSLPRYKWQPGRIVEVVPGRDGRVRSVVLRTETGEIHTNVHRLIPLS